MLQSPLTLAQVANHNKAGSDQNDQIFEVCKQFHQLPNQFVLVSKLFSFVQLMQHFSNTSTATAVSNSEQFAIDLTSCPPKFTRVFSMFITKLNVNLFRRPAIYVYLIIYILNKLINL